MDSAYIIQVQIDNTDEVVQIFARNQAELQVVISRVAARECLVVSVQGLGAVDTVPEYLENNPDDLNFGCQSDN